MKAALKFYWPLLLITLPQMVFGIYLVLLEQPQCRELWGTNVSLLALLLFCFALPVTTAVFTGYIAYISYKALISGRYPPEGVPGFKTKKIMTGVKAKVIAIVGLIMPVLAVILLWLGVSVYWSIIGDDGFYGMQRVLDEQCEM